MHRGLAAPLLLAGAVAWFSESALAQQTPPAAAPDAGAPAPAPKPGAPGAKPAAPKPGAAAPAPAPAAPKPGAAPGAAPPPGAAPGGAPKPGGAKPGAAPAPGAPKPGAEQQPGQTPPATEGEEEEAPTEVPPAPPPPTGTRGPGAGQFTPMPVFPQPGADTAALEKQGRERPTPETKRSEDQVYAEDWWSHARPMIEIHGYFRVRAELFHNFSLGRIDPPNRALWPMPADNNYPNSVDGSRLGPRLCTPKEAGLGESDDPRAGLVECKNKTQAGANMRFRIAPELHISDNLRIMSQIDMLDNVVLGSTPEGYVNEPSSTGGYQRTGARSGYAPLGFFDTNQAPPTAGVNSYKNSIAVKRAWAEYVTPVGQLRFGRMPDHWGLGIVANSGDGYDDDYQSTADRIMFTTGIKALDLYLSGAWDFANEGQTSESLQNPQGQPYDLAQLDDVDQWVVMIMRRQNRDLQKLSLAKGDLVLNGGGRVVYRKQVLAADSNQPCASGGVSLGCDSRGSYARRDAAAWIPDLWLQVLYKKFRFELEAVTIQGHLESIDTTPTTFVAAPGGMELVRQYGFATEISQKLVEDRLKLEFKGGWASGDQDVNGPLVGGLTPGNTGLQPQFGGDSTISTFRFHPNYKIDLILNRNILQRIQGVYYLRPSVEYDFVHNPNGQRFGGNFAAIWTRASQFVQTPGHARDLGIELDASIYFQSKDGALNDDPERMGGFFTMLQYGVLFPLHGLDYQSGEVAQIADRLQQSNLTNTSTAQIIRWYLGVFF